MLLIPQVLFFLIGYEIRYRMFHFQFSFHNMSEQFVAFNAANRAKKLYFKNKQSVGWRDGVRRRRSVELRRCVAGGIIFSKIFLRLQRSGRSDRPLVIRSLVNGEYREITELWCELKLVRLQCLTAISFDSFSVHINLFLTCIGPHWGGWQLQRRRLPLRQQRWPEMLVRHAYFGALYRLPKAACCSYCC